MIGRVLFIGLSVQAVLGLLWVLCNFAFFQEYEDSLFLEKVSESLVCDDYTGILYPLLIRAARGIASVVPVPYYCLLYLLQLGLGYASAFFFLKTILARSSEKKKGGKKERLLTAWGALILVTIPAAVQCHLAVLPCSLTGSLLLLQLGILLRENKINEKEWTAAGTACETVAAQETAAVQTAGEESGARPARTEALLGIFWLLETLLMPEYLWIGVIPVLAYGISEIVKSGRGELSKRLGIAMVAAAFLGLAPLSLELTTQPGAYGRMENTFEGALMRRICGGHFQDYYGEWPQEVLSRITQEDLAECIDESEGIDRVLGREIEGVMEEDAVKRLYREMVRTGWIYTRPSVCRDVVLDFFGYGLSPVFGRVYLRMTYFDSYARGNYDVMRSRTPRLTYYAVIFECFWFALGLALTAVLQLVSRAAYPRNGKRNKGIRAGIVCGGMGLWITLCYTMQGYGRMDQKRSMIVTIFWFAWMCCGAIKEIGRAEE